MDYYDAHCHLQFEAVQAEWPAVRKLLVSLGVSRCVVNATGEHDWDAVAKLAKDEPIVWPCYGVHPWQLAQTGSQWLDKLDALISSQDCGIGEIGLDRTSTASMEQQLAACSAQLALAGRCDRPVTIHCHKAWADLLKLLATHSVPGRVFLIHGFNGSKVVMDRLVQLGGFFSCNATLFAPGRQRLQQVIRKIPLERLLLETDAPEMPGPLECREVCHGSWQHHNHPANIVKNYQLMAELLGLTEQQLATQIAANFNTFFQLNE